jgi:hypothetical protein
VAVAAQITSNNPAVISRICRLDVLLIAFLTFRIDLALTLPPDYRPSAFAGGNLAGNGKKRLYHSYFYFAPVWASYTLSNWAGEVKKILLDVTRQQ